MFRPPGGTGVVVISGREFSISPEGSEACWLVGMVAAGAGRVQPRQGLKAAAPTVYGRGGTSVGRIGLAPQSRPGEPHISLNIRAADGEAAGRRPLLTQGNGIVDL